MESKLKNIIKIMVDTMIYDKLYENEQVQQKFIEYIESGRFKFYSTDIQEAQIRSNPKPGDKDKIEWSLELQKSAVIIPSLLSYDVEGAGYDQGSLATPSEYLSYNKIMPKSISSRHNSDKNIATIACAKMDLFVTDDKDLKNGIDSPLPSLKVLRWNEFVDYISKVKFD